MYYDQEISSVFEEFGVSEAGLSSEEAEKKGLRSMAKMNLKKKKKFRSCSSLSHSLKVS